MQIIRKSTINLNYSTQNKKDKLDLILNEYNRVINEFISLLWNDKKVNKFVSFKINSWLSARLQQCAGKQAIQIIKSLNKKNKELIYKKYKKVYAYFKSKNRQLSFINKRFNELNVYRKRIKQPNYKPLLIEFDTRFINIQNGKNSFDLWIKLSSIGNKLIFELPSRKHKHFNKLLNQNFIMKKSCRLRKIQDNYYLDVFFEKELSDEYKIKGEHLGIDIGINKLLSLSNSTQYGLEFKTLLNKLNRKKQKSKRWFKTIQEIKNYIRQSVNKINFENINLIVMEEIKNISKNTKKEKRVNKTVRQYLSKWNYRLIFDAIRNKCEENRVFLTFINPKYTSRFCPVCQTVDKNNRNGEYFKCVSCGYEDNADINASKNILNFYLNQQFIVADTA